MKAKYTAIHTGKSVGQKKGSPKVTKPTVKVTSGSVLAKGSGVNLGTLRGKHNVAHPVSGN